MRLQNRVAIVTGSSSGLGRAIALRFAAEGARVVCSDLTSDPPSRATGDGGEGVSTHEHIEALHGADRAIFTTTDVAEEENVRNLVDRAVEWGGRLDIMVNNAGMAGEQRPDVVHEVDIDEFDKLMSVNVRGVVLGCKYACKQFLRQEPAHASKKRGWIINTASIMGLVGLKSTTAYCASKGAVLNLTRAVAVDYAEHDISCNALCPGFMQTPLTANFVDDPAINEGIKMITPMRQWGRPEDITGAVVFLASDDARFVTGAPLVVDGGYTAQ